MHSTQMGDTLAVIKTLGYFSHLRTRIGFQYPNIVWRDCGRLAVPVLPNWMNTKDKIKPRPIMAHWSQRITRQLLKVTMTAATNGPAACYHFTNMIESAR
jgi:hypothetical protein